MKITTASMCALCGILPLTVLPTLPAMQCVSGLFFLACMLCLIPHKSLLYAGLTLLFFLWGILAAKDAIWAANTLPADTRRAVVQITGTDHMTTHYGQITHLQGDEYFHPLGSCYMDNIYPVRFVRVSNGL